MNTPEWSKYTGSNKQINEINNSPHGYRSRLNKKNETEYLICQPHPYADLIKIWADTGCPVYAKHKVTGQTNEVCGPRVDWNHEDWEFSLTPFED